MKLANSIALNCSGDVAWAPAAAAVVFAGRLHLRFVVSPFAAATGYTSDVNIVAKSDDVTTYARMNFSTRVLTVSVGGVTESCLIPLGWSASNYVEFSIEMGGGIATRLRYRVSSDYGATWGVAFDPKGGVAGSALGSIPSTGSFLLFVGAGHVIESGNVVVAPAWSLQFLPTDDAAVKAHFRPDGGVTLVSGNVSGVGSQVSGVSASQGTAGSRPAFSATSLNSTPGFTFDGTADFLAVAGLSAAAGNVLLAFAIHPLTVTSNRWLFDCQTGRLIIGANDPSAANTAGYFDAAGAWRGSAVSTTAAQVLVFDLRAAPGGRVYRNGVQIGSTTAYTATALGGTMALGSSYPGSSAWFHGVIGDVVIASGQTDDTRTNVTQYLGAKIGVAVS